MQCMLASLPALLLLLFPKGGSGIPFALHHRFRMDPFMFGMDPELMDIMQENAFDKPEFKTLVDFCHTRYINGRADKLDLGDSDLTLAVVHQCEKLQQGQAGFAFDLSRLMDKVTQNPRASLIFNQKE